MQKYAILSPSRKKGTNKKPVGLHIRPGRLMGVMFRRIAGHVGAFPYFEIV